MITVITGAPGAGKSAALVDLLMRIQGEGRAIYADGIPDLTVTHTPLENPRAWMTEVPDGAAIVIDEVQRVWRPRGSGAKVPPDIEALETHRHRGLDFFLVTQHPNLIDANVRRLVGRHIHLRDNGVLGRWWYEWPECAEPQNYKSAPIRKKYSLPKAAFGAYKSASLHVKPIRSFPRALVIMGVATLFVPLLAWKAWAGIDARMQGQRNTDPVQVATAVPVKATTATAQPAVAVPPPVPASAPVVVVSFAGCIRMGARCECIDTDGRSREVRLEVCQEGSERSGTVLPYLVRSEPQSAPKLPSAASAPASSDDTHDHPAEPFGFDARRPLASSQ